MSGNSLLPWLPEECRLDCLTALTVYSQSIYEHLAHSMQVGVFQGAYTL